MAPFDKFPDILPEGRKKGAQKGLQKGLQKTTTLPPMEDLNKFVYVVLTEWEPQNAGKVGARLKKMREKPGAILPKGWEVVLDYCALDGGKSIKLVKVDRNTSAGWDPKNPWISAFSWNDIAKVTIIPVIHVDLLCALLP
jgi:hypothetical protein